MVSGRRVFENGEKEIQKIPEISPLQESSGEGFFLSFSYLGLSKKDGSILVDPSPYTINVLIAYDENALTLHFFHIPKFVSFLFSVSINLRVGEGV